MKTRQFLLTLAFTGLLVLGKAQTKYEFMIIEFTSCDNEVAISIDHKEFKKEPAEYKGKKSSDYNATPLFKYVSEYQDKGWEVMNIDVKIIGVVGNSNASNEVFFAFLRRKKD